MPSSTSPRTGVPGATSPATSPLSDRLRLLQPLARRRHLASNLRGAPPPVASQHRTGGDPERSGHRLAERAGGRGGQTRGSDTNKRVKGRKRHLMVDTEGLPVAVAVTDASANDKRGARLLLAAVEEVLPRLKKLWADGAYESGPLRQEARDQGVALEVVKRSHGEKGFVAVPRRWVVERTFAWLLRYRRLCRDFERLTRTVESLIYVAMTRLLLNRLTPTS